MRRFLPALLVLLALGVAGLTGCGGRGAGTAGGEVGAARPGWASDSAAGLAWAIPADWSVEPERRMRVATYSIPAAGGDTLGAECAVSYFGPEQGGSVEANFERWIGQFQPATASKRSTKRVAGLEVSLLDVAGTYTAPGGPMMHSQGSEPGWRLLGAIVQGPEGAVFFKLTGPAETVSGASADFDAVIGSLRAY